MYGMLRNDIVACMEFRAKVTFPEARKIQEELRSRIRIEEFSEQLNYIAGVDISSNRFSNTLYAGWVLLAYPSLEIIEQALAKLDTKFPYVPGFLSFREIPALLEAYEKLKIKPDVTMVDGQGIAHPRRLGIAAHLGLVLDIPTIGCAKSLLYGVGDEPLGKAGSVSYLRDPKDKEIIGAYLRTKERAKPVIISPGNRITLEQSLDIARTCARGYRIPEPTRCAHETVNMFRRGEIE
jgi:deoxyribonuclease V